MYFCPECNFSFDINKTTKSIEEKIVLKKIPDIFKKIEDVENLELYKTDIKLAEVIKNIKYKKLTSEEITNLNKLYEESITEKIEFQCNNCNYNLPINESLLLYEYNIINTNQTIHSIEENKLFCKNPLLPRTHDYICKNTECLTHTDKTNKESVFFRETNLMKINYICCICYYSW
jgi:predicted nucleic acid binding AN1-type Zn finger protein